MYLWFEFVLGRYVLYFLLVIELLDVFCFVIFLLDVVELVLFFLCRWFVNVLFLCFFIYVRYMLGLFGFCCKKCSFFFWLGSIMRWCFFVEMFLLEVGGFWLLDLLLMLLEYFLGWLLEIFKRLKLFDMLFVLFNLLGWFKCELFLFFILFVVCLLFVMWKFMICVCMLNECSIVVYFVVLIYFWVFEIF